MVKYTKSMVRLLASLALALNRYINSAFIFLKGKKDEIKSITASSIQLVPSVIKKPSVLWRWLFTSYWFYLSFIIGIILMNTVVGAAIDESLSKIYPPIRTEKFFGLMVQEQNDPRIVKQRKLIRGVLWGGACGLSAYILILNLPCVVRKATCNARNKEAKADAIATEKPSESILLYNKALKLAVDQSHESSLKSKIDTLDNAFRSGKNQQSSLMPEKSFKPKGTTTLVLPIDELFDHSKQENVIGPDGRYRIEKTLGQGAMGIVFLAKDQLLFRDVALKKLTAGQNQDQDLVTRFQQEARALARLSHPNIVQIYDFVQEEHQYWIAMEYVEGKDLNSLINERGKFSVTESLRICIMITDAMDYAHSRGVVHRDFKPSNVLVTSAGEPKVMDFGLAKLTHSSIATMEGSLIGSPAFMSPEQAMGKAADERSDIYALGVTLYQLLTGKLPFKGDLRSVITQKIAGHQPSVRDLENQMPADLVRIVTKMMASEPEERPVTMKDLGQMFRKISQLNLDPISRREI